MNWTNFTIGLSVVTIVVMGFIVLSPAHASSGCLDKHENVSRINPTELSDYQKCVHKHYGNEVGTVGDYIWMQHNGEFIYIKMDKLVGKSNAQVQQVIIQTIVDQTVKAELAQAQADLATMERLKLGSEADVRALQKRIADLTKITEAVTTTSNVTIDFDLDNNHSIVDRKNYYNSTVTVGSMSLNILAQETGVGTAKYTVVINGSAGLFLNQTYAQMNGLTSLVQSIAKEAYDRGYEDGYAAGYVAGYNQAVTDLNN